MIQFHYNFSKKSSFIVKIHTGLREFAYLENPRFGKNCLRNSTFLRE